MNVIKPHGSLNVSTFDASVAFHGERETTSCAPGRCLPSKLSNAAR